MFIFALIPIFLLVLPIIAIVMAANQSSRLKALEREVAAMRGQAAAPSVASSSAAPVPAASVAPAEASASAPLEMPVAPAAARISDEDSSGRILGRIGIAAVLIGVAFFLKYAFDNDWIGPAGRVMVGVLIGLGFAGLGQYLRAKYLRYSDLLIGGGTAILYLSIFAAQSFYHLIDPVQTSILMFVVTFFSFAVSIYDATQTLAVVAVVGAFWTPFLVGFGADAALPLLGYMILVNIGVLGVSFFKKWLRLNIASFVGTALVFSAWFGPYYTSDQLGPVLAFSVIAFLIFLASQVARGIAAGVKADQADYLLMGANAFGFGYLLYDVLSPEYHSVLGFAAVLVALVYIGFAFVVNRANPGDTALNIFLPGLSVVFLSIAVPMQFSGPWIAVAWFVESCALYGIASVIGNRGFQVMGLVVYILGLIDYLGWYYGRPLDPAYVPFFNAPFGLLALAIAAAYVIAYIYRRYGSIALEIQKRGIVAFVVIANVLSIYALSIQIATYYGVQEYRMSQEHAAAMASYATYSNGYDTRSLVAQEEQSYADRISGNGNASNTLISIAWTLYAAALTAIGFARRLASLRRFGLVLFIVTAFKVLIDVWSLGQLYRIVSFIAFGAIALAASFGYVKYKDRLKGVLSVAVLLGAGAAALLGASLAGAPAAHAAFDGADWRYMRAMDVPSTSGFVKAFLPADISWTSRSDPFADIRIIDGRGDEVPYILDRSLDASGPVGQARIIGLSAAADGSVSFIADFGQAGDVHTELDLGIGQSPGDFRRQVGVYASDSLLPIGDARWSSVASNGYIYRITDRSSGSVLGKYSVAFPANASRYLKVVIASGEEGPVSVVSASARRDVRVSAASSVSTIFAPASNDPIHNVTDIVVDLGAPGRLSDGATLDIGAVDTNYIRRVVVHASDSLGATSSERYVGEGSISRVSTSIFSGASNSISYPEQRARYIRLTIVNDDNPPLSVGGAVEISSPVLALIFQARPGASYTLYYGDPSASQPEYDLGGLSSYIDQGSLPLASIGAESSNPAYVPPAAPIVPYTESHAWVLNAVLAALVLILGAGVAWYLRSYIKPPAK